MLLFFVRCFLILSHINLLEALSTSQIYDLVEKGVKSGNETYCNELLDKYYFTYNKDNAIWSSAMQEIKNVLNEDLPLEEHITLKKDMELIKQKWSLCKGQQQSEAACLSFFDTLHDTMKDFHWSLEGDFYISKNYISLRVAYQSMVMLMFSSMASKPWVTDIKAILEWYGRLRVEHKQLTKYMTDFQLKLKQERPIEIGDAEVCIQRRYMWKEFEQPGCEKRSEKNNDKNIRVSRDISKDDGDGDESESGNSEDEDQGSGSGDSSLTPEQRVFFETFANPDMNSVDLIGGASSEYDIILLSRFMDKSKEIITGKKEFHIRETPKGDVIEEMINETHDKRDKYEQEKFREFDAYVKETLEKVIKISTIFSRELKKITSSWMKKL